MFAAQAKTLIDALQGEIERLEAENKYGMSDVYELHKQVEAGMEKQMAELVKEKEDALKLIQQLKEENDELRDAARGIVKQRPVANSKAADTWPAFEISQLRYALYEEKDQVKKCNERIDTLEEELLEKEARIEERDQKIKRQEVRIATLVRTRDILAREGATSHRLIRDLMKNRELEKTVDCMVSEKTCKDCNYV